MPTAPEKSSIGREGQSVRGKGKLKVVGTIAAVAERPVEVDRKAVRSRAGGVLNARFDEAVVVKLSPGWLEHERAIGGRRVDACIGSIVSKDAADLEIVV